jgi:hypothetical protein
MVHRRGAERRPTAYPAARTWQAVEILQASSFALNEDRTPHGHERIR